MKETLHSFFSNEICCQDIAKVRSAEEMKELFGAYFILTLFVVYEPVLPLISSSFYTLSKGRNPRFLVSCLCIILKPLPHQRNPYNCVDGLRRLKKKNNDRASLVGAKKDQGKAPIWKSPTRMSKQ